tara:strand:- start:587 stop:760 length:174 start_codon:yes stop_codon:yes gene_type:complete
MIPVSRAATGSSLDDLHGVFLAFDVPCAGENFNFSSTDGLQVIGRAIRDILLCKSIK